MKLRNAFFLLLTVSTSCFSAEGTLRPITNDLPKMRSPDEIVADELTMLDNLIVATKANLQNQTTLKGLIQQYQQLQAQHLKNDQDIEILFKLVKKAYRVLTNIQENHLTHLFDQEFLSELTLFSQIASKRGIPK